MPLLSSRIDDQDGTGHLVGRVLQGVPHRPPVDFAVQQRHLRARKELTGPKAAKWPVSSVRPVSRRLGPAPPPRRNVWSPNARRDLLFPRKTLASSARPGPTSRTPRRAAACLARRIPPPKWPTPVPPDSPTDFACMDRCDNFYKNDGKCRRDKANEEPYCQCTGSYTGQQCETQSNFAYIVGGSAGEFL